MLRNQQDPTLSASESIHEEQGLILNSSTTVTPVGNGCQHQPTPKLSISQSTATTSQAGINIGNHCTTNLEPTPNVARNPDSDESGPTSESALPEKSQNGSAAKGLFGLASYGASSRPQGINNDPYDYEKKYSEDTPGEEMGPSARVWRTYLDESNRYDREMVASYRDTTDVTLVFAGLFSAIVTTFVVQTSQSLQRDYAQILVSLVSEQIALQRAAANGSAAGDVPASSINGNTPFVAATGDKWVNGLWFMSLTVSLSAALLAVLVKQWMRHYDSAISGTPVDQVRMRHFRFMGVQRWHVAGFMGSLLPMLQISLLLYFSGLVLFLWNLDIAIGSAVIAVAVAAYSFSVCSTLLPLLFPQCPYHTAITSFWFVALGMIRTTYLRHLPPVLCPWPAKSSGSPKFLCPEVEQVAAHADEMEAEALLWLHGSSSNPTVQSIVFQSFSGLSLDFTRRDIIYSNREIECLVEDTLVRDYRSSCGQRIVTLKGLSVRQLKQGTAPKLERLSRSLLQLAHSTEILSMNMRLLSIFLDLGSSIYLADCQQTGSAEIRALCYMSFPSWHGQYRPYEACTLHDFIISCIETSTPLPIITRILLLTFATESARTPQVNSIHWSHIIRCLDKLDSGYLNGLPLYAPSTTSLSLPFHGKSHLESELSIRYLYHLFIGRQAGMENVRNVRVMFLKLIAFAAKHVCGGSGDSACADDLRTLFHWMELVPAEANLTVIGEEDMDWIRQAYGDVREALKRIIEWTSFTTLPNYLQDWVIRLLRIHFTAPIHGSFIPPSEGSSFVFAPDAFVQLLSFDGADKIERMYATFQLLTVLFKLGNDSAYQCFRALDGLNVCCQSFLPLVTVYGALDLGVLITRMFYSYISGILDPDIADSRGDRAQDVWRDDVEYLLRTDNLSRICQCFAEFRKQFNDVGEWYGIKARVKKAMVDLVGDHHPEITPDWARVLEDVSPEDLGLLPELSQLPSYPVHLPRKLSQVTSRLTLVLEGQEVTTDVHTRVDDSQNQSKAFSVIRRWLGGRGQEHKDDIA